MKQQLLASASVLALVATGCQSLQSKPTEYVVAVADPLDFTFTGWVIDHCADEPPPVNPGELTCLSIGGEIYSGKFSNLRVLGGALGGNSSRIGVVGHAYPKDQRGTPRMFMVLQRTPQNLLDGTSLEYMTVDHDSLEDGACFQWDIESETGLTLHRVRRWVEDGWHCYEQR